ncbi:hypothetical protein SAMN05216567_1329 [Variovorax sp. OK605]|uniref:beta strand repeat-containing protein n=1 Tax=Variovorax sp. OK605 TaxID=1855317 RepID=UPI0008ED06EA|nr:hypothetical protein [Variovorax sp. OK605]SFQ73487.1 hypothetical protein SAMN05216567_1329 [Variovorax sp. OK605]
MDDLFGGRITAQGQTEQAYAAQLQAYISQTQAFVAQVPFFLRQFSGNLGSAGYSGPDGTANALSDVWGISAGAIYQGLSLGAQSERFIPGIGIVVGATLDSVKGIQSLVAENYGDAVVSTFSIVGGGVGGFLGGAGGAFIGGGTPFSIPASMLGAGMLGATGSRLFAGFAQTVLGYENGKSPSGNLPQLPSNALAWSLEATVRLPGSNLTSIGEFSGFSSQYELTNFNPLLFGGSSLGPDLGYIQPDLGWAFTNFGNTSSDDPSFTPISPELPQAYPDFSPGLNFPLFNYGLPLPDLSLTEIPDLSFPQTDLGLLFPGLGDYGDFGDFGDFGPVILNLDGKGLNLDTLSSSTQFVDTNGSDYGHRTAWAAAGNGVLALDLYGDGQIHQKNQYAFTEWDSTSTSDLQALKDVFDTNHNGRIDAGDASWSQFKVVANGQMVSLYSLGITSIDLTPTGSGQTFADGSAFTGTTSYTKSDGTKGQVGDAVLATDGNGYLIHQTQTTNAGGSVTTDIVGSNADGSKAFENVSTLGANGLTKTINYDDNGDGIFDRSQSIATGTNADGSFTQTISNLNADGSLKSRTATTTSADTSTVATQVDQNGDGVWDQSQVFVRNANGSTSTTTKNLTVNGAVINQTQVTTSTDGLIKTTKVDNTGSGIFDQIKTSVTAVNADGSRVETVTDTSSNGTVLDRTVTNTSADARSKTVSLDHTGAGNFDLVTTSSITVNTDKSVTTVVQDRNADGSLRDASITTLSADGRSKTVSTDLNGDGSIDQLSSDMTVIGSDGSRIETITSKSGNGTLLGQTVTTTSADKETITTTVDANGDDAVGQTKAILVNADGSTTTTVSILAPNGSLVKRTLTTASASGLSTTSKTDINGDGTYDLVTTDTIVANADGSRTETIVNTSANGTLTGKSIITTGANGLTQSKSQDLNGDGITDQTTTDTIVLNAGGSRTETLSVVSGTGTSLSKTTTATSADHKTTTKTIDSNGDGHADETQVSVLNADGSVVQTVTDTNANGSLKFKSTTTTSANGLSTTSQSDVTGDGTFDSSVTDVTLLNSDGSKTETFSHFSGGGALLDRTVLTTSGNGLSVTKKIDVDGDGAFDSKTTDFIVMSVDGSKSETISTYNGDGSKLINRTTTVTSGDGLSKAASKDLNGDGVIDHIGIDVVTLNTDGSKIEILSDRSANGTLLDQTITTTSADGKITIEESSDIGSNGVQMSDTVTIGADGSRTEVASTYTNGDPRALSTMTTVTSADGLKITTKTDLNGDGAIDESTTSVESLNADGSKVVTVSEFKADGSLKDRLITTTSAGGLSVTTQMDATGAGTFSRTTSDAKTFNADGSTTEVARNLNADGSLHDRTTTTTSADKKTKTVSKDINGDGILDKRISTTLNADGSAVTIASDLQADGVSIKDQKTTTTSANGLSTSVRDAVFTNGVGATTDSYTSTTVINPDGSTTESSSTYSGDTSFVTHSASSPSAFETYAEGDLSLSSNISANQMTQVIRGADGSSTRTSWYFDSAGKMKSQIAGTVSGDGLTKRSIQLTDIQIISPAQKDEKTFRAIETVLGRAPVGTDPTGMFDYDPMGDYTPTPIAVFDSLISSSEFQQKFGALTDAQFASLIYQHAVGVSPDSTTMSNLIAKAKNEYPSDWRAQLALDLASENSGYFQRLQLTAAVSQTSILQATQSIEDDVTVLNADGSKTRTVSDTRNGILIAKIVTTTSADGLAVSTKKDTTGSGVFDQDTTIRRQILADSSTIVTVNESNNQGILQDKTITTTSGDGRVVRVERDFNGDGKVDQVELTTNLLDGSTSDVITNLGLTGSKIDQTSVVTSFDGLTATTNWDYNGDGINDSMRIATKSFDENDISSGKTQDFNVSQIDASGSSISHVPILRTTSTVSVIDHGNQVTTKTDLNSDGVIDRVVDSITESDGTRTTNISNNTDLARATARPAGTVAWVSALVSINNTLPIIVSTTESVDGLSKKVSATYTGLNVRQRKEEWFKEIDGSWSGSITEWNPGGVVIAKGTETISADGRTTSLREDSHNSGLIDHTDVSVVAIDGSITETVTDLKADGSLKSSSVTTVDATGNHQHIVRNDGSYTDSYAYGGIGLDGAPPVMGQIGLRRSYDAQGRLEQALSSFSDGTSIDERYDTSNSQTWSTTKSWLNVQGEVVREEVQNDDGTRSVVTPAGTGGPGSVQTQQYFDAQGRLTQQRDNYADSSYRIEQFDTSNTQTWSTFTNWYNSQGTLTHQQAFNHDGTRDEAYPLGIHALTGGGDPSSVLTLQKFDAQGREVLERNNYAGGSHTESQWDATGTQPWSSVSTWFNAQGQQTRQSITNHDGTGADVTNVYNAQGQPTHQTIARHDGTRTEISSQVAYVDVGNSTPGIAIWTQQNFNAQGALVSERDNLADGTHVDVVHGVPYMGFQAVVFQYYNQFGLPSKYLIGYPGTARPEEQYSGLFNGLPPLETPVVLDLDNKGAREMLSPLSSSSPIFDIAGDGQQHRTAWASAGEGILAIDADGTGKLDQQKDIVFTDWEAGATSDMQALRDVFDTNQDGQLDARDARWTDFRVVVDGRVETLDRLGIASIGLTPQGEAIHYSDGSSINGTSLFTRTDGSTGLAGDAAFRYDPTSASGDAGSKLSTVQTQAVTQLNQLIGAMASFAPPASAQTALTAANDSRLQTAPLLAVAR